MLVVGLVLVLVGAYALVSRLVESVETSSETYAGITRVELDLTVASVHVRAGGSDVVVDQRITSGLVAPTVRHEVTGETLLLVLRCPLWLAFNCSGVFDLTVPPDTELTGRTANGRIDVGGVDGPIDVSTSNGAIILTDISGPLRASTSNGAVTATAIDSVEVELRSSNGSIELEANRAERIVARTSNGRIDIVVPSDAVPYAVDASTSNGSTRIDIRTDPGSSHHIEARTSNGNITIGYR